MRYYLIFIICFVIVSCSLRQPHNDVLKEAELLINFKPDTVVGILSNYNVEQFEREGDRALYILLFIESLHCSGLSVESDSLISICSKYYERIGDNPHLARALLHHGIILYKKQHLSEGIQNMKRAELLSKNINNDAFKFYLYSVLGDINDNAGNVSLTLSYYRRALKAAKHLGDTTRIVQTLNNIATTFDLVGKNDSLKKYLITARPMLKKDNSEIYSTFLVNLASYYLNLGRREQAKRSLEEARQVFPTEKGYKLLADVYMKERDTMRAVELWYHNINAFSSSISINAYKSLIDFHLKKDIPRIASLLSMQLNRYYDNIFESGTAANTIDIQMQFDKMQDERKVYRTTIAMLFVFIGLSIVIGLFVWYHFRRVDQLNSRFTESQEAYFLTRERLTQMRKAKEREERENSKQLKEIVSRLHNLAMKGREGSSDDWNTLAQISFALRPNLQSLFSSLSEREVNVCLLIRQNFLPSEIAILTCSSPQAITNMRVRLLQKLFNRTGGARDFDQLLCDYEKYLE